MAKRASVLRQFEVSSDDGGMWIEHRYKACDWLATVDGWRLTDLMKQATAHARVCDGKPRPRPAPRPSVLGNTVMDLWGAAIKQALKTQLLPAWTSTEVTAGPGELA